MSLQRDHAFWRAKSAIGIASEQSVKPIFFFGRERIYNCPSPFTVAFPIKHSGKDIHPWIIKGMNIVEMSWIDDIISRKSSWSAFNNWIGSIRRGYHCREDEQKRKRIKDFRQKK